MYIPVALYNLEGQFLGYSIKGNEVNKLQTTNIWQDGEEQGLNARLAELNENVNLNTVWPHPQDPEVLALLDNPEFVPIELVDHEVIDEDHSLLVYLPEPEIDKDGQPTGRMVDGQQLDRSASVVNFKTIQAPKRPTDVMWRIKRACETVARQRAGLVN